MKKESLQTTTVKTLLAVLLFAGMGIIIIGGGCIIWEYSKNNADNQITKPVDIEELNIIGNYDIVSNSMCLQNCSKYYIGQYYIGPYRGIDNLKDFEGINLRDIVWVNGDLIKIMEPPTIAGPDSHKQVYPNKVEVIKLKIDDYQKIDFPKISISEEELANYLENKDAEFTFKFVNPLNQELRFKFQFKTNTTPDFQYVVLKPKESKSIQYIHKKDIYLDYKRKEDNSFELTVINDFVDNDNYNQYYRNEANNLDSKGTFIRIYKWIKLEDCMESDISDWQTYRNEEVGFEFEYPVLGANNKEVFIKEKNNWIEVCVKIHGDNDFCHHLKYYKKLKEETVEDSIKRQILDEDEQAVCTIKESDFGLENKLKIHHINCPSVGSPPKFAYNNYISDFNSPELFLMYSIGHDTAFDVEKWVNSIKFIE